MPRTLNLLGAYADFLLDNDRSLEVLPLLGEKTGTDPLLLRYALALQAQHSKELAAQVEKLRDRFAASRLRGDRVHLREEARFTLHLLAAPAAALEFGAGKLAGAKGAGGCPHSIGIRARSPQC